MISVTKAAAQSHRASYNVLLSAMRIRKESATYSLSPSTFQPPQFPYSIITYSVLPFPTENVWGHLEDWPG